MIDDRFAIKFFSDEDYSEIVRWYMASDGQAPPIEYLPQESTFLVLAGNSLILSVSLILSNSAFCYAEFFIGNPDADRKLRQDGSIFLADFIRNFAHESGYQRIACFAPNARLRDYYQKLGFSPTLPDLTGMTMKLED